MSLNKRIDRPIQTCSVKIVTHLFLNEVSDIKKQTLRIHVSSFLSIHTLIVLYKLHTLIFFALFSSFIAE